MGRLAEVTDLDRTAMLLAWDQEVCMPAAAAGEHGELRATLGRFAHERFVDDRVGELLEAAAPRDDVEALRATGRQLVTFRDRNLFFGGAQAVERDRMSGTLSGAGDPRRGGAAVAA